MRFTRVGMLAAAFFLTTLAASAQIREDASTVDHRYHQRIGAQRLPVARCQREPLPLQRPEYRQSQRFEFQLL